MDKMLYTATNSARQAMQAQTAVAHNLANSNTTAFKSHLNTFTSWRVEGPGLNTRVMNQQNADDIDMTDGPIITTGRDLDVAINGKGFIAVENSDGKEAYTRAGDFKIDNNGLLTTGAGFAVLGNGGPIAIPPAEKIIIGFDGSISIVPIGQPPEALVLADKIKLVNPEEKDLVLRKNGLFQVTNKEKVVAVDPNVKIESGMVEQSNVNGIEQMLDLISNARQFETSIKLMQEAKTMDEASSVLLRNS